MNKQGLAIRLGMLAPGVKEPWSQTTPRYLHWFVHLNLFNDFFGNGKCYTETDMTKLHKKLQKTPDAWRVGCKNPGNSGHTGLLGPAHRKQSTVFNPVE